jgi:enoyl-CoA hydratase/carnithine racemase
MEIKWGRVPDMAGIVLMRGLVRDDAARELLFSGRVLNGQEALALGLGTSLIVLQLVEQSLGLLEIARVEAFGEPVVDRREKIAGLIALALTAPETRHAHRRAQFP